MNQYITKFILLVLVYISQIAVFATPTGKSKIVSAQVAGRQLSIYLPANYDDQGDYKTIYFHDGQALFGAGWNLGKKLDQLIQKKQITPLIVVGIHSTNERTSDLTPFYDPWITQNWGAYTCKAADMSTLIKKQIIPYMEKKYAVSKNATDRALFGASLGGLHAMWDATENPDAWGMVGAISPSFWVKNYQMFQHVANSKLSAKTKIWFDMGTGEWDYYVPIINTLVKKGFEYGKNAFYYEIPEATHTAQSWGERIQYPLIVFAGESSFDVEKWRIEIEVIKSQSSFRFFQRINPIVKTSHGIEYSASSQATFELLNPEAGEVKSDGRFSFKGKKNLKVKVTYKGLSKVVTVNYPWVQDQKNAQ